MQQTVRAKHVQLLNYHEINIPVTVIPVFTNRTLPASQTTFLSLLRKELLF
jgi:hypothetical protein